MAGCKLLVAVLLLIPGTASAGVFSFAGVGGWDEANAPDQLSLLGGGVGPFSAGFPADITQSVAFPGGDRTIPDLGIGFNSALTLGRQAYDQTGIDQPGGGTATSSSAVNLPGGNVGSATRHGLAVSWSGGRTLSNLPGNDFVIYESGSISSGAEGFMVRVNVVGTGLSDWYFQAFEDFELYAGSTSDGAFATVFDLSIFGLADGASIDQIQIANLIANDRLQTPGEGMVLLGVGGGGNLHGFGLGALDPDPLYVGVLHGVSASATVPEPASLLAWSIGLGMVGFSRRVGRCRGTTGTSWAIS